MLDNREDTRWTVYVHTSPSGKYYVGITGVDVRIRWRKDGKGYAGQGFYNAIKKYGWENITHERIADHLTMEEACKMESTLIKKLQSNNGNFGYNNNLGGHYIFAESEDLTGKEIRNVKFNKKLDTKIDSNGNNKIIIYDCTCECGNHFTVNSNQLKSHKKFLCCEQCFSLYYREKVIQNYQSKTKFEVKDDYVVATTDKNEMIIFDSEYYDIVSKYTIHVEYRNNKAERVRCYNPILLNQKSKSINLENLIDNNKLQYVIFKDRNRFNYRKYNLVYVDTTIFTRYHHLLNNIGNNFYLISKIQSKKGEKYYVDNSKINKVVYKYYFEDRPKKFSTIEEAVYTRNELLKEMYKDNELLSDLVALFYSNKEEMIL